MAEPPQFSITLLRNKMMPDGELILEGTTLPAIVDDEDIRLMHHSPSRLAIFYVRVNDDEWELALSEDEQRTIFG